MKKITSMILLIVYSVSFGYTKTDLSNAEFLGQKGIINIQNTEMGYRLDEKITRAEVIGIALKIKGTSLPEDYHCKKYFSDTIKRDWVCRAIELASESGLISRDNKKARPQDSITRAEAFSILFKASGLTPIKEYDTFVSNDLDATQWQKDLFLKIRNAEIEVPGTIYISSNTPKVTYKFFPNRLATRAEVFNFGSQLVGGNNNILVIDGDTVNYGDLKIRMIGLDAPESNTSRFGYTECYGLNASNHLKLLLKDAKEIVIEKDLTQGETDKYGRTLGYLIADGLDINERMILDGYAFEYTYDKPYAHQSNYKSAQTSASNQKLGMWSEDTCNGDRKKGTTDEVKITGEKAVRIDPALNRTYYTGPRGGCYYYLENGNKEYVEKNFCWE